MTLRGALVGYGFIMQRGHAAAYRDRGRRECDVTVVAVADPCEERREQARRDFPGVRTYSDHHSLLNAEHGKLDFCDVATPPGTHAAIVTAALDRGLHVLCEKPLATSVEDARSMLRAAESAQRVLYPCHNYKHAPVIKAVRRILDSGRMGKVHLVTLQTFRNTHARGVDEWSPDWRRERHHSGGGIAMDHGSHTFYLAFEWLRSYPTAVSARTATSGGFDTEDDFTCSLTFPTGSASAHLSWNAGVRKVLYAIHGERGAIHVADDKLEIATQVRAANGRGMHGEVSGWAVNFESFASDWMDPSHVTWFHALFDEFKAAIARGTFVGRDAIEACLCVELITASYESALQKGKEQRVQER